MKRAPAKPATDDFIAPAKRAFRRVALLLAERAKLDSLQTARNGHQPKTPTRTPTR